MGASEQPLVTIGLPVYNAGPFLAGALQSIFAQTVEDWELIVVDDGSSDDAWEIVEHISDRRVRAIRDRQHRGLAARLNQIIKLARGRYLMRMDADDMCHPHRVERQVRFLQEHPEIDAVSTSLAVLDRKGRFSGWRRAVTDHGSICAHPLRRFAFVHAAMMARTEWARRHRYSEHNRRCEDWEMLSHASTTSRFANLTDCLYFYREYDSFSLPKYAQSKLMQFGAEWRERSRYGLWNVLASGALLASHVMAYTAATSVAAQPALIRRRSVSIPERIRNDIEGAAAYVISTQLPGRSFYRPSPTMVWATDPLI